MDQVSQNQLLGTSGRVRRGFNRLGVGVAALVLVGGLCGVAWSASAKIDQEYAIRQQALCLKPHTDKLAATLPKGFVLDPVNTANYRCFGPEASIPHFIVDMVADTKWEDQRKNILLSYLPSAGVVGLLAAIAWALFSGVGWIFSGFFRD